MSKWIPLLVRIEDYPEMAALVAEREADHPDSPAEVTTSPGPVARASVDADAALLATWTPWSVEQLEAFSKFHSATAQRWTRAMDACCEAVSSERPWLSTAEVAARTGMDVNEWRDAARKLTRHLRANFPNVPTGPDGEHIWPLLARGKAGSQEVHWAMNPEQAHRWRQVRVSA
ncbi:MAG: hypothetical protein M3P04_14110 [Actinomycetota bacterium]|nr:hypothetical protein [Actinomycetota bacterium]